MKRAVSLVLVLAFTCICLVSCISPKDFKIKDEISESMFVAYDDSGAPIYHLELYGNEEALCYVSHISDMEHTYWEVKYTPFGAYVVVNGEKYVYDFDEDTLTRKSDGLVFYRLSF